MILIDDLVMSDTSDTWQQRISAIRKQHNLSQEQLAEMLGTNQACVSRWERGVTLPNYRSQRKIITLAREYLRDTLTTAAQSIVDGTAGYGAAIFDRNEVCIAASPHITHKIGKTLLETTRPHEHCYLDDWRRFMTEVDFWNMPGTTFTYVHESRLLPDMPPQITRTLLTPVIIEGEVYCLIELKSQETDTGKTKGLRQK